MSDLGVSFASNASKAGWTASVLLLCLASDGGRDPDSEKDGGQTDNKIPTDWLVENHYANE